MTKDVLIKVSGMQYDVGDEPIELVITGTYYLKNGKHYVLYEEQPEGDGAVTKNIVKFNDHSFEMIKKGGNNSYLRFEKLSRTSTVYQTPIGPMQIDIYAKDYEFTESEQELFVRIQYTLDINYDFISECQVEFKVQSRLLQKEDGQER